MIHVLRITEEERQAILDALRGVDDEYGLHIGMPDPLEHTHTRFDNIGNTPSVAKCPVCRYPETLEAYRKAVSAAYVRGDALIEKVKNLEKGESL
jgi:hypothetical protein